MNRRMSIGLIALAAALGGAGLLYVKDKRTENAITAVAAAAPHGIAAATPQPATPPALPVPSEPVATSIPLEPTPATPAGALTYTAQSGDTLSQLAVALLGKDSKANRDLIVSANPSLQENPDHVVIGRVYERSAPSTLAPAAPAPDAAAAEPVEPKPELKYTAKPGDTVDNLAGALLGGQTQTNRDAIVNANSSLQSGAGPVVAGRTYRIPAPDGLSAATKPVAPLPARPTTRPDSDDIIQAASARSLTYTAKPGDTVTSLAIALLGSDTQSNRDAIINTNASLKSNPDRVIAGQTYWIPAPVADVQLSR